MYLQKKTRNQKSIICHLDLSHLQFHQVILQAMDKSTSNYLKLFILDIVHLLWSRKRFQKHKRKKKQSTQQYVNIHIYRYL